MLDIKIFDKIKDNTREANIFFPKHRVTTDKTCLYHKGSLLHTVYNQQSLALKILFFPTGKACLGGKKLNNADNVVYQTVVYRQRGYNIQRM